MKVKKNDLDTEAGILKQIDEKLKGLSPDLRKDAFQILVGRHLGTDRARSRATRAGVAASNQKPKRGARKASATLSIVKDLDLRKDAKGQALREFYKAKSPRGFLEHNAVFVYYLTRVKGVDGVTPSHVYTCYKEVGARVPGAFYQSLLDTARRKGWVDTGNTEDLKVTTVGENFVEHDLPRGNGTE